MKKKDNIELLNISRYTNINFPFKRYIPGEGQHPKDLEGQIHIPHLPESTIKFSNQTWKQSEFYLYAIDLFNHQYYWEVHEVLEKIWLKIGKTSPEGVFIQGIIQLSVAMLKKKQLNKNGVKRLADKALPKILSQHGVYLGIDIENFLANFNRFLELEEGVAPIIVLEFV